MPTAGYSGTPLAKKLGIRDGARVVALNAPERFQRLLVPLPPDVDLRSTLPARGASDVIVFFTRRAAELRRHLPGLMKRITPEGGIWVAWAKRASGVATDVTEDTLRDVALPLGLVDNKVCAIDETWSGLRLVIRVENRPPRDGTRRSGRSRR